MDIVYHQFMTALKKEKSKSKGAGITPINFENYQLKIKGDGKLDLRAIADLNEWTHSLLKQKAHQLNFFFEYHPKSHRFWMNDIETVDEEGNYTVSIDLEDFMESSYRQEQKNNGRSSFMPDNYELAKKVMKEFKKDPENKKYKFEDQAFRECANWKTKNLEAAKALGNFIQKNYIEPDMKTIMKNENIVDFKFSKNSKSEQIDFVFKKDKTKS